MTQPRRFGRVEIDPVGRQLRIDGQPAALGARAFDLLLALVERRDRVVPKSELLDLVWPGLVVEENNLQVQVSSLRKLLGAAAIATVPGRGYRFTFAADGEGVAPTAPAATPAALDPAPLYGRADELAALQALICSHRLVTIVGAGGIGKTRVAAAVVQALTTASLDTACMVELAALADPDLLPSAVAQALHFTLPGRAPAQQELVDALRSAEMLLVLDNCEHLLAAATALVEALRAGAPGVRLLATSQEPLRLPAEQQFRLAPLALPAAGDTGAGERGGALELFEARARAVDPGFALGPETIAAAIDICRRLDGLPLAIELAAARVRLFGLNGLRDRLVERFRVLSGGARSALPRHRTLLAALDWSHALLGPEEQRVLRRLGVFAGGFKLEAAQAVAADEAMDEWAVLEHLGALVDKSLVVADAGDPPRCRLLESTRAYALGKLADAGESEATRRRHAETFAALFERADDALFRGELSDDALRAAHSAEIDNLRAAMDWAVVQAPLLAVGMFAHSEPLLFLMDLRLEGWLWSERLRAGIDEAAAPLLAAKFWLARSHVRTWQIRTGEVDESLLIIGHAVRLFRAVGDGPRLTTALGSLAMVLACDGDHPGAQAALAEMQAMETPGSPIWLVALRAWVQAGVDQFAKRLTGTQGLDHALAGLRAIGEGEGRLALVLRTSIGQKLLLQRRFDEAAELLRSLCEQARRQRRDSNQMAWLLSGLGLALTAQGRLGQARGVLVEALPHLVRSGLLRVHAPAFAWLLAREGHWADAARLLGVASDPSFRRRADIFHASGYTQELLATSAAPQSVAAWLAEGAAMDHDAVVAMLLREAS